MARVGRPPRPGWEIDTTEWLAQCDRIRAANPPQRPHTNLVQTALAGEVGEYIAPDHSVGENFPGRQPSTVQLSLFDAGVTNAVDGFPKKYRVSSVPKCDKP